MLVLQSSQVYSYEEYEEDEQKTEKEYKEILEKTSNHSPRHQIKMGVLVHDVKCDDGLELVLRHSNGLPACVKSINVDELINRGWALDTQETTKILEMELNSKEKIIQEREEVLNERQESLLKQENNTNEHQN
ncbi:hypothetical protein BG20_I2130 [Candidatus Nitrosarchaeum limnium BG20]|jgi:hypothetical protein|uniref:Uncharacterized protein n=2 Tax=Nitrosarchaeum TaxID=1007082 RepID=S2E6P2_9ARCH|nr:hypothetical protein BG20_I2130 [Candidatus Nitrosarchaeum limnium BG20]